MASGRPILGALPHGDARDLVEQSGRSCCSEPCDDAGIANALCNMLSFADKFKYDPKDNESFYEQYEWKRQCALFFDFINTRIIKSL